MMRRAIVGTLVFVFVTTPASAQFAVIDPANLAQAILIVQRTQRHLEELQAQYRTIMRMAQGLGRMDQYRIPPSALTGHDVGRWTYGSRWIAALNSGDATGAAYLATATPLAPPNAPGRLTAAARRAFERQYATVEITDSVAMMGGHHLGGQVKTGNLWTPQKRQFLRRPRPGSFTSWRPRSANRSAPSFASSGART